MHVALIDDDIHILEFLAILLKELEPCEPVRFTNPAEAVAWCASHDPDLVIVDYLMPEMDGVTFVEHFRALPERADTPILMLTAETQQGVRYRALQAGANDFLNKPIDQIELTARVRNMLALRQSQRRLRSRADWLAEEVQKATSEIVRRERETIYKLSRAAEYRDQDTGGHIRRMAHYSRLIARNMGMDSQECELLLHAAPMHDVGKVGIPDRILLKPGPLNPEETKIMRNHTVIGHKILDDSDSRLLQMAATVALTHHEHYDGSGYPRALAGDAIPVFGRIVAVADVFDALSSRRPYKDSWHVDDARAYMQERVGGHFDPACVQALFSSWNEVMEIAERYPETVAVAQGRL